MTSHSRNFRQGRPSGHRTAEPAAHAPARRLAAACLLVLAGPVILAGCAGTLLPKPPAAPARFTLD
ncbi:MAG: hypothetical protein Q8M01_19945, partial [Rubrivivax sp.]|nr:hypothetical protein [Rubrivivax sp.]